MSKFKSVSHQPIEDIRRLQEKHKRAIVQPRDRDGEINPAFLKEYGAANLRITERDIRKMKNPIYARKLHKIYEYRHNQKS